MKRSAIVIFVWLISCFFIFWKWKSAEKQLSAVTTLMWGILEVDRQYLVVLEEVNEESPSRSEKMGLILGRKKRGLLEVADLVRKMELVSPGSVDRFRDLLSQKTTPTSDITVDSKRSIVLPESDQAR